jgi:pimeloyl-ACP methyl ester carboxylesterase
MEKVRSKDGTPIAYHKFGQGPAVILVTGALGTGSDPMFIDLAERLGQHFTAIPYDRRGRGQSGDSAPYAPEREIEDIDAIIEAVGGSAYLYGLSSGAVLALKTAAKLSNKVKKLALYEPPFIVNNHRPPLPADYVPHLDELIAQGRRGDAVEYFMTTAVGIPAEYLAHMRADPMWPGLEAVAHTIAYDGRIMGNDMEGRPLATDAWATATMPILVMAGEVTDPFMQDAASALAAVLPNAQHRTLAGQNHGVASEVLAPVLVDFFSH